MAGPACEFYIEMVDFGLLSSASAARTEPIQNQVMEG